MNGWDEGHPAWWLNVEAHPDAVVRLAHQQRRRVRARPSTAEERDRLWQRRVAVDPDLDAYAGRRTETPVVVFEPRNGLLDTGRRRPPPSGRRSDRHETATSWCRSSDIAPARLSPYRRQCDSWHRRLPHTTGRSGSTDEFGGAVASGGAGDHTDPDERSSPCPRLTTGHDGAELPPRGRERAKPRGWLGGRSTVSDP